MKPNSLFFSLAVLALLSASCSRQVTSLNTSSRLETASLPVNQPVIATTVTSIVPEAKQVGPEVALSEPVSAKEVGLKAIQTIKHNKTVSHILEMGTKKVAALALSNPNAFRLAPDNTASHVPGQINTAGFILIAGGVLGFLLHLIWIACAVLVLIGLIVLLSPLFHKKY